MSDSDRIQYKFMIPAPLKAKLEDAAHGNRRSLSAEIIARLESSFTLFDRMERTMDKEDDLRQKILEMQADLTAFMIMGGQDPAEVRKHWEEAAARIRANKKP